MPNLNKVQLMGNLTRDPEVKYSQKGTAMCQLSIAVNRTYSVGDEKREEVTFIDIEAFGKQAETIGKYFHKGRPIFIEGRLKLDTWEDKQSGQKRSKLKVVLEGFQFLGSKPTDGGEDAHGEENAPERAKAPARRPDPPADPDLDSDPDEKFM
jgi:single-strand DNA-binding protein